MSAVPSLPSRRSAGTGRTTASTPRRPGLKPLLTAALIILLVAPLATDPATATPAGDAPSAVPAAAAASIDAVPGGPRSTDIRLSEDDASTTVLIHGIGSAAAEQVRENRSYRHSDLQPTARFARAGDRLTITVPDGAPRMTVGIGLTGVYAAHNGGVEKGLWRADLHPGTNELTAPQDGMVHLISTADGGSADVVVVGGEPVPAFVQGRTTTAQLHSEMDRLASAPFVQIVGDRFFGDFQKPTTGPYIAAADTALRVSELDDFIRITNDTYGLSDDGTGVARKAPHRIYIASADSSSGYANASNDRIMFQVSSGAAADLFRSPRWDQWGFWHEVGHTYQTPTFNWNGLGEVLVNLSALHIQSDYGWTTRLDGQVAAYDRIFAEPVDDRDFQAQGSVWGRLFFFDHLRRAFGDDFYPRVNQELRVLKARGERVPTTDEQKRQLFAATTARVADRDLREFFRQWGIPLSAETEAAMARLPELEEPIWLNRLSGELIREYETPAYSIPQGPLSPVGESVTVGQRRLASIPDLSGLSSSDGVGTVDLADHSIRAVRPGTGVGAVDVTVVNHAGVREFYTTPVTVRAGDSFHYVGISGRDIARLAYAPATSELRLFASSGYPAHDYFPGQEYVGATVYDERGDERASFSVQGQQTAHAAAAAFDGTTVGDGWYVVVRHREASTRLVWWADDVEQPRSTATTRTLRVDGSRLVEASSVPGTGATSTTATGAVGRTTGLARIEVSPARHGIITVDAPAGTAIADVQVRRTRDDHRWTAMDYSYDDDRRTVTVTNRTGAGTMTFGPGADNYLAVSFAIDPDAPADAELSDGWAAITSLDGSTLLASTPISVRTDRVEPITAVPADGTVALTQGGTGEVPFAVQIRPSVESLAGALELTAPTGTRFADHQEALVTELRRPGGEWVATDAIVVDGAVRSDSGATLTFTVRSTSGLGLPAGTQLRWAPSVTVPRDLPSGGGSLDWVLTGTVDGATVTARS